MQESVSLPRIKPTQASNQADEAERDRSMKFKKLRMPQMQQKQSIGMPPLRHSRTERSYSLATNASVQQRKRIKTQRINITLAEKKMREGHYDEQEEVGTDLASLKRQCSEYCNRTEARQQEIEKLKEMVDSLKAEKAVYLDDSQALVDMVNQKKEKCHLIRAKCEDVLYEKSRLNNMIKDRKTDNIDLMGKIEDSRFELTRIRKYIEAISRNEAQMRDRDNEYESKYRKAVEQFEYEVKQIRKRKQQDELKRQRMAENHANRDDRKRKLIDISASVVLQEKEKQFRHDHNSYLTHKFISRFLQDRFNRFLEKNDRIYKLFRSMAQSYGPFTAEQFSKKYFGQEPERDKITQEVKRLELQQFKLETHQRDLRKQSSDLLIQFLALGEQIDNKNSDEAAKEGVDPNLEGESMQAEGKLQVVNDWGNKKLKQLETLLVEKRDRSQNIQKIPVYDKLSKILALLSQWTSQS